MSDIFPMDLRDGCRSLPGDGFFGPGHLPSRPQSNKARTVDFSRNRTRSHSMHGDHTGRVKPLLSSSASTAILFKDSRGYPVIQPLSSASDSKGMEQQDDILNFFKCYKCYDLIPTSAKLVVLDTQLVLKKAFFAMVDTGVRACPLWDSDRQAFVGMLTITDFIRILQKNYKGPLIEMEAFEEQKLLDWKGITEHTRNLIFVSPDASLFEAVTLLIDNKIHRLPIIDPSNGNVLYIINQKPLLRFLFNFVPNLRKSPHLNVPITDAGVGTFQNIEVAREDTTIIEALNKFVKKRISALPIVDGNGRLLSIYSKFDVINLAAEKTYEDLEVTLKAANQHKQERFDGVHNCKGSDSVLDVMEKLVKTDVNKLVVVDEEEMVTGIVTVSDVIHYIVLRRDLHMDNRLIPNGCLRRRRGKRREDSIGEEEECEEEDVEDQGVRDGLSTSCSPPRWFNV